MTKPLNNILEYLERKNKSLENENKKLKRRLSFAHTTINDLRYAKRIRDKELQRRGG